MLEKCVPGKQCQSFQNERSKLTKIGDSSGKESEEYQQLLAKLKGMVCNAKDETVCCEDSLVRKCSSKGRNNGIQNTWNVLIILFFFRDMYLGLVLLAVSQ